jgi:CDP-diacylglycerol--glycerol-3-phosphate 3-phosphatidyltransferase
MHQALLFAVGFLFLSSSTSSSFGSLSHAKFSKTYNNNLTKTTSFRRSNPLLQRGGSDEPASTEESDVAASTSTALLAESDSNTESVASVEVPSPMGPNASKPGILRKLFPSLPWHTVPNLLTYARCLAIPALIVQFYTSTHANKHIHSSLIFAIASITDYLDGYLARRWDICSPFGAFLDPVADKLMVSTALILLTGKYGYLVAIPTAIILAREIAVSALREWMASRGARDSVKVGFQGKVCLTQKQRISS